MNSEWSSDWYKDRYSDFDQHCSPCLHSHVVVETTGELRFVQGEISDNIQEHLLCLDCLEILGEQEVLSAWHGDAHFVDMRNMEADHDEE